MREYQFLNTVHKSSKFNSPSISDGFKVSRGRAIQNLISESITVNRYFLNPLTSVQAYSHCKTCINNSR